MEMTSASKLDESLLLNSLRLNNEAMDSMHEEFVGLLDSLKTADKRTFITLFSDLMSHTKAHFEQEQALMESSHFSATQEHCAEHLKILGELAQFEKRVVNGNTTMARAYVKERLPEWFALHVASMDSALAAALANQESNRA